MPDQPIPPLDALQAQLRGAIDQQLAAVKQHYEDEIATARRDAAADAERQIAARLEAVRAEWTKRAEADVAAARKEGERSGFETAAAQAREQIDQAVAQARLQIEKANTQKQQEIQQAIAAAQSAAQQQIEQALAAAKAEGQRQTDQAVAAARKDAQQQADHAIAAAAAQAQQDADKTASAAKRSAELEFESERRTLQQQIEETKQRAQNDAAALRKQLGADLEAAKTAAARAAETPKTPAAPPGLSPDRMVTALQNIDSAASLSQALDALLRHASSAAGRAAIFSINGDRLKAWKSAEVPDVDVQTVESSIDGRDLLARAIQSGQLTRSGAALPSPPFARLPADRDAAAVPLLVGGRPVAVLYVDAGGAQPRPFDTWAPAIDVFARHASAVLGLITATRTLELMSGNGHGSPHEEGDEQAARRYARLLVSEIKLYNEGAVRVGRQQRDLLQRLHAEIDRARQLYEERIPPGVGARHLYFQQELVQTLADGDPSLLGNA